MHTLDLHRWIDANYALGNSTGSREEPFRNFEQAFDWLGGLVPQQGCRAHLHAAPGFYRSRSHATSVDLTLDKCLDCPDDAKTFDNVIIQPLASSFLFVHTATLFISNVTFTGAHIDDSAHLSIISVTASKSTTFDNVTFTGFHRHWTILFAEFSNLTLSGCLVENNYVEMSLRSSGIVYSNFLDSRKSDVILRDTIFRNNELVVNRTLPIAPSQLGTTIVSGGDKSLSVLGCSFINNSVLVVSASNTSLAQVSEDPPFPHASSKTYYGGALLLHFVSLKASIINSTFAQNSIFAQHMLDTTGGAAIGVKTGTLLHIEETNFIENYADSGGALFSIEEDGRFGDLALITVQGGVVRGHYCRLRGCGFAFQASRVEVTVTISTVLFEDNSLYNVYKPVNDPMELSGGAAVAFLVDQTDLPVDVTLLIRDSTFRNNSITHWTAPNMGGGRALATFQVAHIIILDSIFHGTEPVNHTATPVIWSRWFESILMDRIQVYNFTSDEGIFDVTLFDFGFATSVVDQETPLIISNWQLVDCYADTIFKVSDMSRARFENVTFTTTQLSDSTSVASRILDVSFLSERLEMKEIQNFGAGVVVIANVPEFRLADSLFSWEAPSRFKWQIELSGVSEVFVTNSRFILNHLIAGISAPLSKVDISNSKFYAALLPDQESGAALSAENSITTIRNCNFTESHANSGSAVSTSGPLTIQGSRFTNGFGGSVKSNQGPLEVRTSSFEGNWTPDGGAAILFNTFGSDSRFLISSCIFNENKASKVGGALYLGYEGSGVIEHSSFNLNQANAWGGALSLDVDTSIHNCTFVGNFVTSHPMPNGTYTESQKTGGAIRSTSNLNITGSTFIDNESLWGGAIMITGSSNSISSSSFSSNWAGYAGGAIAAVTLTDNFPRCKMDLSFVQLVHNTADRGGALFVQCILTRIDSSHVANNFAYQSGGAVFSLLHQRPTYSNVSFIDNSSQEPGGTFFYDSHDLEGAATDFCGDPSECTVSVNGTEVQPPWGSVKASSALTARISRISPLDLALEPQKQAPSSLSSFASWDSTTPLLSTSNASSSFYLSRYLFELEFTDLYHQDANQTFALFGNATVQCHDSSHGCPFYAQVLPGSNALTVVLLGKSDHLYRPSAPFSKSLPPSLLVQPQDITLHLTIAIEAPIAFIPIPVSYDLTLRGCPTGHGISKFTDPAYSICQSCPISSYNLDGDGYCYLCNPQGYHKLECEGSIVSYRDNNWMTPINGSNELLVEQCFLGFCKDGSCAPHRTGLLCGECAAGSFSSLLSACSPTICAHSRIGVFFVAAISIAILTTALHLLLSRWSSSVMFFCLIAQLAILTLSQGITWSIPYISDSIAGFLCGYRMNFMERSAWLTFAPYASLLVLALMWLLVALFSKIRSASSSRGTPSDSLLSGGRVGDWRRVLSTAAAILYINSSWTLSHSIRWFECQSTGFGYIWLMQPSIHCDSPTFLKTRAIYLSFSLPLIIIPLLLALITMVLALKSTLKPSEIGQGPKRASSAWSRLLLRLHAFNVSAPSRWWHFVELIALKLAFPIVESTLTQKGLLESGAASLILILSACASAWFKPLFNKYLSAAGPLCALGILAIMMQDITSSTLPPLIVTVVVLVLLLVLAMVLILGRTRVVAHEGTIQTMEKFAINAGSSDDETAPLLSD